MITLYGIKNCDTVKKARRWLEAAGQDYRFHDLRADGLSAEQVQAWLAAVGETLINRRSTTWKQLSEVEQARAGTDPAGLLVANPTLIKRPVLTTANTTAVGFSAAQYQALLNP